MLSRPVFFISLKDNFYVHTGNETIISTPLPVTFSSIAPSSLSSAVVTPTPHFRHGK